MNLQDARKKLPELNGLSDESALNVIHQVYYPNMDKADLAGRLGYKGPEAPAEQRSTMRAVGDLATQFGTGVASGVRMMTDIFGADNRVSHGLRSAEDALGGLLSAQAVGDQQKIATIMKEAEGKGWADQVFAGLKAAGVAPGALLAQAAGTSIPTLVTALIPGAGPAAVATRLGAAGAMGAAQGAGNIKGVIYEEVKKELSKDPSLTPEQIEARAVEAQSFGGQNAGQIALGGALGVAAGTTGMEKVVSGLRNGVTKTPAGIMGRMLGGGAAEAVPEFGQGSQEKYASNVALGNEGFDVDPMNGVIAQGTMEAAAGFGAGALTGIPRPKQMDTGQAAAVALLDAKLVPETGPMTRAANVATEQEAKDLRLGFNPLAGTPIVFPDGSVTLGSEQEQQKRATDASSANLEQAAKTQQPRLAGDVANVLAEAESRGLDFVPVLHPAGGGFMIVPRNWVTPDLVAQAAQELNTTIGRMQQADAEPVQRAERRNSAAADVSINADPVAGYVDQLRSTNTPAARAFVGEFDAGRITRQDVEIRMLSEREKTPDEMLAAAAAQAPAKPDGLILSPSGEPFKTKRSADITANKAAGTVIEVPGGFAVRQNAAPATSPVVEPETKSASDKPADVPETDFGNTAAAITPETGKTAKPAPAQAPAVTAESGASLVRPKTAKQQMAFDNDIVAKIKSGEVTADQAEAAGVSTSATWPAHRAYVFSKAPEMTRREFHAALKGRHGLAGSEVDQYYKSSGGKDAIFAPVTQPPQKEGEKRLAPELSRKLQEAHKALGYDVTLGQVQKMYDRTAKEVLTGKTNNGGVEVNLNSKGMKDRREKLERLGNDLALFGEPVTKTATKKDANAIFGGKALADRKSVVPPNDKALDEFAASGKQAEFDALLKMRRADKSSLTEDQENRFFDLRTERNKAVAAVENAALGRVGQKPVTQPVTSGVPEEGAGGSQPPQAAPIENDRYGIDHTPFSTGGKPFKTKVAADRAKKLQPAMRVVKVEGGVALADKTAKQLAAEAQAAKRIRNASSGNSGMPMSAHEFIASEGGMSRDAEADLGIQGNQKIGNRWLYAGKGKGLSIEQAALKLREAGYTPDEGHSAAIDVIRRSMATPQYTSDGRERIGQAGHETRFEDYLSAQQEFPTDIDSLLLTEDELAETGYNQQDEETQAEIRALIAQAEAADLMAWESMGTKGGVTKHILTFYESKADKDANRGRMTVATVTKGDRSASAWMVDGDDQTFGPLSLAKKRGMEVGIAKAVADGFVQTGRETVDTTKDKKIGVDSRGRDVFEGTQGSLKGIRYTFDERGQVNTGATVEEAPAAPSTAKKKPHTAKQKREALENHFRPGNVIQSDYFKEFDRVVDFSWSDGNWKVTVERVVKDGEGWKATEGKRTHMTTPNARDKVVFEAPAPEAKAEPSPAKVPEPSKSVSKTPKLDSHMETMKAVRDGTASPEQYKAGFVAVADNAEAIKAELNTQTKEALLRSGGLYFYQRHKQDTKPEIVEAVYGVMLEEYAIGKQYGPTGYVMGQRKTYEAEKAQALRDLVDGQTAETLAEHAAEIAKEREEFKAKREAKKQAIENPQTLEDFNAAMRVKVGEGMTRQEAFLSLTPEQRTQYDELDAESTRKAREDRKRTMKTQVMAAGQTTGGEIVTTKHTRSGEDLFVVKLAERVSREDYGTLLSSAKKLGGWYSSFRGAGAVPGFQFKEMAKAEAFLKLAAGDTAAAQEQVEQRRDAFEDDRSQSAAERLNEMADALQERAEASLSQERKANTARRARFAASADREANEQKALAQTMRNIAKAIEDGKAKFLDAVRQKVQIEFLRGAVRTAKDAELRAKYPSYAEQEKRKGEPPTAETADFSEFPAFTAFRSDLASLARQLLEVDGTKKMGQQIMGVADDVTDAYLEFAKTNILKVSAFGVNGGFAEFDNKADAEAAIRRSGLTGKAIVLPVKRGENRVILSPSEAINRQIWTGDGDKRITLKREFGIQLVEAIGRRGNKQNRLTVPWQFQNAADRLKMLARMGIETGPEYRSALREFIGLQERATEDKVRKMELAMVGRKADGLDFFPTPETVADQMIEAAEIAPEMSVLEPSAGMGHIADRIREAGAEPDVIEISPERRELLQEKGYNTANVDDFMDLKARQGFTFGDLMRAPDGTVGILRGQGGLGSERVRLVSDEADPRELGKFNYSDLEGVEHRGDGYDRIIMNPPFSDRRDAQHVQHAYTLLKPGGRIVAIMGEGVFFGSDKKAEAFRDWLDQVGGTSEKLPDGSFMDPSLPVTTGVNARMVVIDKPKAESGDAAMFSRGPVTQQAYEARIDALFSGEKADRKGAVLLDSSDIMGLLNHAKAPMVLNEKHLVDGLTNHPEMTAKQWKRVPEWLENPAAVYTDPKHPGRLTVIAPELAAGYPVVMAVEPNPESPPQGHKGPVQLLVTAFAKTTGGLPPIGVLASSGRLLYADTKMAPIAWLNIGDNPRAFNLSVGAKKILTEKNLSGYRRQQTPAMSRGAGMGMTKEDAQDVVNSITDRWGNAPDVVVVQDMNDADVPEAVRKEDAKQKSQGSSGESEGFFHDGKAYIVAGALRSPGAVMRVLFHETLGHYGLRGTFGDGLTPILKQLAALRRTEVAAKAEQYGLDMKKEADRLTAAEEVLAEMAQSKPEIGFVKRVIALIRGFLRKNVPGFAKMQMTDADIIANYILPARAFVEQGKNKQFGSVAFSRTPNENRNDYAKRSNQDNFWQAFDRGDFTGVGGGIGESEFVDAIQGIFESSGLRKQGRVHSFAERGPLSEVFWPNRQIAGFTGIHTVSVKDSDGGLNLLVAPTEYLSGSSFGSWDSFLDRSILAISLFKNKDGDLEIAFSEAIPGSWARDQLEKSGKLVSTGDKDYTGADYSRLNIGNAEVKNLTREALRRYALQTGSIEGLSIPSRDTGANKERVRSFGVDKVKAHFSRTTDDNGNTRDTTQGMGATELAGQVRDKLFDVKESTGNTLAHYRGMALQALGRRQLVDLYGDMLPQLKQYDELVQRMDAEKNDSAAEADAIAKEWGKLDDKPLFGPAKNPGMERKLAELMHDATLAQMDPDKPLQDGDNPGQHAALKAKFDALSPQAQSVYRRARDMYEGHYAKVREAIQERIMRSELGASEKKAMIAKMDADFFQKTKGVYFPLARFGKYVMVVKDAEGKTVNVSRAETLNEAETTRKMLLREFDKAKGYAVTKVMKEAEFNRNQDMVGKGFVADLFAVLDKQGVDDALRDSVSQLYLSSLPDLSWAKHGIHRKGTPGFSQDARRAFAQNVFHGARYLAKLRYSDQMQNEITAMGDHIKVYEGVDDYDGVKAQQVLDEMAKRHDNLMSPETNSVSTALTSVGYMWFMGLSPAAAMVNLSQTALVAYPVMGAKWGYDKAASALLLASKQTVQAKNDISKVLKGDELDAYNRAVADGTIDVTMAHDLAGISQGEDAKVTWALRPVMKVASFMFHHAERFNRQATFIASYRLAKESGAGLEAAFEQAKKATYDGHFDYSASNRPRIMQGNVARVVFLFKQYGQNMIYTMSRQAYVATQSLNPKERAEARKQLGGMLALHAAAAGALGLPLVGALLSAASFLGSDDDEPWDAEVALKNAMADAMGPKAAEVMAHGLSRLTPWDISGRVALNKLILPDVQEGLEGQRWAESMSSAMLGPVWGIVTGMAKGVQEMGEGRYQRGLENMLPVALRNPVKALRYQAEGAIDKTGVAIKDEVSMAGVLGQASGFAPSEVRAATEVKSAIFQHDKARMDRRKSLMSQFAQAQMAGDSDGMQEMREAIAKFNAKNPERKITPRHLILSVRNRERRIEDAQKGVYLPKNRRDAIEAVRFGE